MLAATAAVGASDSTNGMTPATRSRVGTGFQSAS